jgi:copper chaperone
MRGIGRASPSIHSLIDSSIRGAPTASQAGRCRCPGSSPLLEDPMERLSIPIVGMSCGGCVRSVREALARVPGVKVEQVTVGAALVSFDPAVTAPEALREVIASAGFQPQAA